MKRPEWFLSRKERKQQQALALAVFTKRRAKEIAKARAIRALYEQQQRDDALSPQSEMPHSGPRDQDHIHCFLPMQPPADGFKLALWQKQSGRCQYCCGSLLPRYHVDHVHPKSKGGQDSIENFRLACEPCNLSKSDKPMLDFVLTFFA